MTTFAPDERIFSTRFFSIFSSWSKNACIWSGEVISILLSISVLDISISLSISAILAFLTCRGMPGCTLSLSISTPLISMESSAGAPDLFSIFTFSESMLPSDSTIIFTASTVIFASFSLEYSAPFPVIAVVAILIRLSLSSFVIFSEIAFRITCAFSDAILYPLATTVG